MKEYMDHGQNVYKLQECFEEGGQFDIDFLILDKDLLHHYQGKCQSTDNQRKPPIYNPSKVDSTHKNLLWGESFVI